MPRNSRLWYIGFALGTIAVGLVLREASSFPAGDVRDKLGDALWAAMIAWWIGALAPNASLRVRAAAALAFCFAVELSQLFHTEGLDSLRRTGLGQLVLGSSFDVRDFAAYTVGVLLAGLIELLLARYTRRGAVFGPR